jgi:hypothetical protein
MNLSGERFPLRIGAGRNEVELPDRPDTPVGAAPWDGARGSAALPQAKDISDHI